MKSILITFSCAHKSLKCICFIVLFSSCSEKELPLQNLSLSRTFGTMSVDAFTTFISIENFKNPCHIDWLKIYSHFHVEKQVKYTQYKNISEHNIYIIAKQTGSPELAFLGIYKSDLSVKGTNDYFSIFPQNYSPCIIKLEPNKSYYLFGFETRSGGVSPDLYVNQICYFDTKDSTFHDIWLAYPEDKTYLLYDDFIIENKEYIDSSQYKSIVQTMEDDKTNSIYLERIAQGKLEILKLIRQNKN